MYKREKETGVQDAANAIRATCVRAYGVNINLIACVTVLIYHEQHRGKMPRFRAPYRRKNSGNGDNEEFITLECRGGAEGETERIKRTPRKMNAGSPSRPVRAIKNDAPPSRTPSRSLSLISRFLSLSRARVSIKISRFRAVIVNPASRRGIALKNRRRSSCHRDSAKIGARPAEVGTRRPFLSVTRRGIYTALRRYKTSEKRSH